MLLGWDTSNLKLLFKDGKLCETCCSQAWQNPTANDCYGECASGTMPLYLTISFASVPDICSLTSVGYTWYLEPLDRAVKYYNSWLTGARFILSLVQSTQGACSYGLSVYGPSIYEDYDTLAPFGLIDYGFTYGSDRSCSPLPCCTANGNCTLVATSFPVPEPTYGSPGSMYLRIELTLNSTASTATLYAYTYQYSSAYGINRFFSKTWGTNEIDSWLCDGTTSTTISPGESWQSGSALIVPGRPDKTYSDITDYIELA